MKTKNQILREYIGSRELYVKLLRISEDAVKCETKNVKSLMTKLAALDGDIKQLTYEVNNRSLFSIIKERLQIIYSNFRAV